MCSEDSSSCVGSGIGARRQPRRMRRTLAIKRLSGIRKLPIPQPTTSSRPMTTTSTRHAEQRSTGSPTITVPSLRWKKPRKPHAWTISTRSSATLTPSISGRGIYSRIGPSSNKPLAGQQAAQELRVLRRLSVSIDT